MKNMIIGTAGHVDHGKTLLIKALTGVDTDRLKEEKKRGITIELGFARMELPDGQSVGIIDVPGHEKFIKNMLAGAGGIDLALLVVAADDGVMPQTREHLGILSLLDIQAGIIVITKADLVDADWIELVTEDVRALVKGSFLESAPILPVSAYTGQGLDALRAQIGALTQTVGQKSLSAPFRIPADRVFTMEGFGTVITGTLIEGSLQEGDEVAIYPSGTLARVRNLQVHSQGVQTAWAGQRVAVNLGGIKKEEISRGDVLAAPGSMEPAMMLDVKLRCLPDSSRVILNGSRIHFYHGSREVLCKVILLDTDALEPGQEAYAQLRFTEEIAAKRGDRFVARFYSPIDTIGGGMILDANPAKHRRGVKSVIDGLRIREQGSVSDNLAQAIADESARFTPVAQIARAFGLEGEALKEALAGLAGEGRILPLSNKVWVGREFKARTGQRLIHLLEEFHRATPLQPGMRREELRQKLLPGRELPLVDRLLSLYEQDGIIRAFDQRVAAADFKITYSPSDQKLRDLAESLYRQGGYSPPEVEEVLAAAPKERAALKQVLDAMLATDELVMASPQLYFHREIVADALAQIQTFTGQKGQITLGEFRDLAGTSRKYAVALLEYFDRRGITQKQGDARVLAR